MGRKDRIEQELNQLYREQYDALDVLLRLTPLEVEHLNNLIDLGSSSRRSSFAKQARREHRRFSKWERHLLALDIKLWRKVREVEKLAFKDEEG